MKPRITALGAGLLLLASLLIAVPAPAGPGPVSYLAGATAVVKESGQQAALDQGGVVCDTSSGTGIGGACLPFGPFDSVFVKDDVANTDVAFQVCIDNDGDSVCRGSGGTPGGQDPCGDELSFSHSDKGTFFNPLGPLPKGFKSGCPGGPFQGYIVFICQGAHVGQSPAGGITPAHTHNATHGLIQGSPIGTGFGNFCSPPDDAPPKPYILL